MGKCGEKEERNVAFEQREKKKKIMWWIRGGREGGVCINRELANMEKKSSSLSHSIKVHHLRARTKSAKRKLRRKK